LEGNSPLLQEFNLWGEKNSFSGRKGDLSESWYGGVLLEVYHREAHPGKVEDLALKDPALLGFLLGNERILQW